MYINPYVPDCECVMFGINDTTDKNDLIFSTNDTKVCFTSSDITIGAPAHKHRLHHGADRADDRLHDLQPLCRAVQKKHGHPADRVPEDRPPGMRYIG